MDKRNEMDTVKRFFDNPTLNSPYHCPARHWQLDSDGQPVNRIIQRRRDVSFITPIPAPKKGKETQDELVDDQTRAAATSDQGGQQYELAETLNNIRNQVKEWRALPESEWRVTPETARLLHHWRHHKFNHIRPFFCQVEAVETLIWLTEVAPGLGKNVQRQLLDRIDLANREANPELARLALKLATGAGKTMVMAMIIAWQTINAVRHRHSKRFTYGFLVVTPGITIRDRLRVLKPNDPDSYYRSRELAPRDMLGDLERAKIVITNFHAFKLRETMELSRTGRSFLQGHGPEIRTLESEGRMLQRVMPELMGMKNILAINDEAHHCYREKPGPDDEGKLSGDEREEAEKNRAAARLWISGLEAVASRLGLARVLDLSATPFFLSGSGYREGTLFPWTVSDFSLMDAIECGIVKLPRVPVADNIADSDMPRFRNLWRHIRKDMPRRGRGKSANLDPLKLPVTLLTALEALYGHYEKTFELWRQADIRVPPCFIVVCNNTSTSKLIYDYISGFELERPDGSRQLQHGRLELFRNFDENDNALPRPRTLLIDSRQLESGEKLDNKFRAMAADEIERFRREIVERTGDRKSAENLSDQDLLREVMNTVGKEGRLGGEIRCVVSVAMLTEGWDANTVTHILGVRAFGTQLLCEQAIGRSLRRQSYELDEQGLLPVEYADVFGIPFDFTAKPIVAPPQKPRKMVEVKAIIPDRDDCEIRFPRLAGYRVALPEDQLQADFDDDSTLILTPEMTGPAVTRNEGIIGEGVDLSLVHTGKMRKKTISCHLTQRLLETRLRDSGESPKWHLFGQAMRIVHHWLDNHLVCRGGTYPAQLLYLQLADQVCERIMQAIKANQIKAHTGNDEHPARAVLDPYNSSGSTRNVRFMTSKTTYRTDPRYCHINHVVCDSDWETRFCAVVEGHPRILSWVKNHGLGLEVPYHFCGELRAYIPDFILAVDDGRGRDDPLHLIVEIKGYRREDAKDKKKTMDVWWIPAVNALGDFGRWAFVEFTDGWEFEPELGQNIDRLVATGTP